MSNISILEATCILGPHVIIALAERLHHAREKHPHWRGRGQWYAENALMGEIAEYLVAARKETSERQKDEILDVIITAIRIYEEEYNEQ